MQLRWVLLLRVLLQLLLRGMLSYSYVAFKGIVSRDFRGLHMILINRAWVPNTPLEVYYFCYSCLHIAFKASSYERVSLSKSFVSCRRLFSSPETKNKLPAEYQGNMSYPLKSFAAIENLVNLSLSHFVILCFCSFILRHNNLETYLRMISHAHTTS